MRGETGGLDSFVEATDYIRVYAARLLRGHGRYAGPRALEEMNRLYALLRLRTNFFLPSMKLVQKQRRGSRVHKRYEEARTPCQRIQESESVSEALKRSLRRQLGA